MTRFLGLILVVLTAPALAAPAHGPATPVRGTQFLRTEFAEFLHNQIEWHGRTVQMHAIFDGPTVRFTNPYHSPTFFKASGYSVDSHFMCAVTFKEQTKHWLYPAIPRKGSGPARWRQFAGLESGDRITLYGELRLTGDAGKHLAVAGRREFGGGLYDRPSMLDVERVERGWVKTLPEYIADLDKPDAETRETAVMLKQAGAAGRKALAAAVADGALTERQRIRAAQLLARFEAKSARPKLVSVVRDASTAPAVRGAALAALQALRPMDAIKELGKLAGARPPDPWATDGIIALLATGEVSAKKLRSAMRSRWKKVSVGLSDRVRERAEAAWREQRAKDAAGLATAALALDAKQTAMRLLRARATLRSGALTDTPLLVAQVEEDLAAAQGAGEFCGDEWVSLARSLLKQGETERAESTVARVLKSKPDHPAAAGYRLDLLVHRGTEAWSNGDKSTTEQLAKEALALDPQSAAAKRLLFLAQDRPMEMLTAKRIGADGLTVAAPTDFKPYLKGMRPDYGQVYYAAQTLARFPGRMPPVDQLDLALYVRFHGDAKHTPESLTKWAIHALDRQVAEAELGAMKLDNGVDAHWAITTWTTRHGHINRKMWVFAVVGERHVHFSMVSAEKLFNAHRTLIFEIARTMEFKYEGK